MLTNVCSFVIIFVEGTGNVLQKGGCTVGQLRKILTPYCHRSCLHRCLLKLPNS
ncbi:hypothetical protein ERIC1_1c09040 [Paenibacillus larvae subsp. larvae DSM 25719]|nr:hypothetical protein ERIC1_1c09040 [Paenibacillus larvae subsp. larvae DSM 25719]